MLGNGLVDQEVTKPYHLLACEPPHNQVGLVPITNLYHPLNLASGFRPLPTSASGTRGHTQTHNLLKSIEQAAGIQHQVAGL